MVHLKSWLSSRFWGRNDRKCLDFHCGPAVTLDLSRPDAEQASARCFSHGTRTSQQVERAARPRFTVQPPRDGPSRSAGRPVACQIPAPPPTSTLIISALSVAWEARWCSAVASQREGVQALCLETWCSWQQQLGEKGSEGWSRGVPSLWPNVCWDRLKVPQLYKHGSSTRSGKNTLQPSFWQDEFYENGTNTIAGLNSFPAASVTLHFVCSGPSRIGKREPKVHRLFSTEPQRLMFSPPQHFILFAARRPLKRHHYAIIPPAINGPKGTYNGVKFP